MSESHGDRSRTGGPALTDGGRDDVPAPSVEFERPDRWRLVDESVETPFDAGVVSVRAHTRVYEDVDLAECVDGDSGGDDGDHVWRFTFASRVGLRPRQSASKPLTALVTRQARSGFADRLRDRGFVAVSDRGTRRFRVGDADATLAEYDATVRAGAVTLNVDGWLAVWPDDGTDYLLAGGAYPTAVADDGGDEAMAARLRECLDPGGFREELFETVRSTA